jgi:predicted deacylase
MHHFQSVTFSSPNPGTKFIVLGAVHGSEKCGTVAIRRVLAEFESGALTLARGQVTFVPITNPKAYAQNTRNGDRNLNRRLRPEAVPKEFEDEIANWLCPLLAQHDVLLDLHSFQAQGQAFATLGPENNDNSLEPFRWATEEMALIQRLGVNRAVDGWLATYAVGVERRRASRPAEIESNDLDPQYGVGTTEYMRSQGGYAITLECGQHSDPSAPDVGYRAIHNALAHLKLIDAPEPAPNTAMEGLRLHDVIDKVHDDDAFAKPWKSFDAISKGELIGTRKNGEPFVAAEDGWIVFPNAVAAAGNEWFYLAKANPRFR